MSSLLDGVDVNNMTETFSFLTINEKLLPFLSLSKSLTKSFTPACFKNDELKLNYLQLRSIGDNGLSSETAKLFFTVIVEIADPRHLPSLTRALKYFTAILSFKFKCSEQISSSQLLSVLKSPSLINIKHLNLTFTFFSRPPSANKINILIDFDSLKFPQLQSLIINRTQPEVFYGNKYRLTFSAFIHFLIQHSSIIHFEVGVDFFHQCEWNELLTNPLVLPQLKTLIITAGYWAIIDYNFIIHALTTTLIPSTNQPRPLQHLSLSNATNANLTMFDPLSRISSLTNTEISVMRDHYHSYENDETFSLTSSSAIKSLTKFSLRYDQVISDREFLITNQNSSIILNALCYSSLVSLELNVHDEINFNENSVKCLIELKKLQFLNLTKYHINSQHVIILVDWTDSSMFTSCQFSSLLKIQLSGFELSRESFAIIAAASPNVTEFIFDGNIGCHPAILCLIIICCCPHIQIINSHDVIDGEYQSIRCRHQWAKLTLEEFNKTKKQFPPHPRAFQQLQQIDVSVCADCTTPDIWFKLLQLFNKAEKIYCVNQIYLSDPTSDIGVMGLSFLPSLKSISDICQLPASIQKNFMTSNNYSNGETVYTELRPEYVADPYERRRTSNPPCIQMSSKFPDHVQHQFITSVVKNGMNGRQTFFDDVLQSLNENDQSTVKQLSHE